MNGFEVVGLQPSVKSSSEVINLLSVFSIVADMTLNIKGIIFEQININLLIYNSWGQLME